MGPLVSVGIPTYNRPQGLRKTLECITGQTYKNIEIIVSDNNSNNDEVDEVLKEFTLKDDRVKYYKQKENIGAEKNFKFVLEKTTGKYFMWASDDDIRTLDCIEYYVNNIYSANAIFSCYAVIDVTNHDNVIIVNDIPEMKGNASKEDLRKFMAKLCPSMMYGMFNRINLLSEFNINLNFDWSDCYFLIKFINKFGYKTVLEPNPRYYAGISGANYHAKPANGKYLNPWKYFMKSLPYILPLGYKYYRRHWNMCLQAWNNRNNISRKMLN